MSTRGTFLADFFLMIREKLYIKKITDKIGTHFRLMKFLISNQLN
jgi:hypothetical protein